MVFNGLLPIGSVVLLHESTKRVMIVGVCQRSEANPDIIYDYVGVVFPEGFINANKMVLFNDDMIDQIFMIGYQDTEQLAFKQMADETLYKLRSEENAAGARDGEDS